LGVWLMAQRSQTINCTGTAGSNAVHVHIDVEFCGKLYQNANFVHGSTVEQAYLRWVPAFGAQPNRKRKASLHMSVLSTEGENIAVKPQDQFPSSADRVVFWSSAGLSSSCSLCGAPLNADKSACDLLMYHRVETAPDPPQPSERPEQSRKAKSKKRRDRAPGPSADIAAQLPQGMSVSAAGESASDAVALELALAKPLLEEQSVNKEGGIANTVGVDEVQDHQQHEQQVDTEDEVDDEGDDKDVSNTEVQKSTGEVSLFKCSQSQFTSEPQPYKSLWKQSTSEQLQWQTGTPSTAWQLRSEHSHSFEYEEEEEDQDLRSVVSQLAGVVRNLATSARETSTAVSKLQQVAAADHAALQAHLQEAREDRKMMLKLLSTLVSTSKPHNDLASAEIERLKHTDAGSTL